MVRAGSILPVGAVKQYSSETVDEPIELRIYAGADGEFVLYDDDGTTNQYEQGASSRIAMKWDDGKRTLTIGKREGTFVGMPTKCSFTIIVSDGTVKRIKYNGKSLKIKI
jgi:alpha-D-xyloside xylohydrolase